MKAMTKVMGLMVLLMAGRVEAITATAFGTHGEGGSKNGQTLRVGPSGSIFELDAFVGVGGQDLNGSAAGVTAQLSRDSLPAGLELVFGSVLAVDNADLVLIYTLTNTTSQALSNVTLQVLVDGEIDQETNTFFNEYAQVVGVAGLHGYDAVQWQVDEPGFQSGSLFKNLFYGSLNNSNGVPAGLTNDVAMGLAFGLGTIGAQKSATVLVEISERGHGLSQFLLTQRDADPGSSGTTITVSGVVVAGAEQMLTPSALLLVLSGQVLKDGSTNGAANPTDIGISGIAVTLRSNGVPVLNGVTDSSGRYDFSVPPGLAPGTYSVEVDAAGYAFVAVPAVQAANFAQSNPGNVALPMAVPVLNFDLRGGAVQFADVSGVLKYGMGGWHLNYAAGSVVGNLGVTNPVGSGVSVAGPWQLGLKRSSTYYFAHPSGVLPDGVTNIDVSAAMSLKVSGGVLTPGQSVVLSNAVEVYSLNRTAPSNGQFELWATPQ